MKHSPYTSSQSRQNGVVMIVMLILLVMVTVLGAALLHMQTAEQRISVNASNRSVAAANAEATLRWAECGLQGGCGGASWTPATFLLDFGGTFSLDSSVGSTVSAQSPYTATAGVTWTAPAGYTAVYGGPALNTTTVPQYAIEKLKPIPLPGDEMGLGQYGTGAGGATPYQVTAYATGADPSSRSVLQSTFRP